MSHSLYSATEKQGLPPGTLIHIGEKPDVNARITVINYDASHFEQKLVDSVEDILPYKSGDKKTWVNIEGLHDVSIIKAIGDHFNIHPLVQEDILNTHQRTKVEEHDDYVFIVLKKLHHDSDSLEIYYEQVSLIITDNVLFTFREYIDDVFDSVVKRLNNGGGKLASSGPDYLAYSIMDTLVDEYFKFQDSMDDLIENLEQDLLSHPTPGMLALLQSMKREMIYARRSASPLREMLFTLLHSESRLIQDSTKIYLQDVYDHAIRVIEAIDSYRDLITSMLDLYLSSVNNKTNEIMKVLTIFASIFIPLTFIVGVYGMNFQYMPELEWKWAYPALWLIMIGLFVALMIYFKKKKWF
ncbi:MAG TPA: magnesium/cobalt transporter CorA [Gammaproteobacteria bacterium]